MNNFILILDSACAERRFISSLFSISTMTLIKKFLQSNILNRITQIKKLTGF
jgi:hypothetical protein